MKKLTLTIIAITIMFLSNITAKAEQDKIAVFPVEVSVQYSSFSIYPKALTLISNDITNNINLSNSIRALDLADAEEMMDKMYLKRTYREVLSRYKNTYTINPEQSAYLAKKLGVTKILFVSGGFDTQSSFLKKSRLSTLGLPGIRDIKPSYKFTVNTLLYDAQSGLRLWEQSYNQDFELLNFGAVSQGFAENVTSINKLKGYSSIISPIIARNIGTVLATKSTAVDAQIVNGSEPTVILAPNEKNAPNTDYIINKRKTDYKQNMMKKFNIK